MTNNQANFWTVIEETHVMRSPDTTAEDERLYFEMLRRLGPAGRFQLALDMNQRLRDAIAAGVRLRHPEYDDDQVQRAIVRLHLGEKLFREVLPNDDIES
jgi:hypothetical protein